MFFFRNFEESEDELRDAVADSMRNLYVMDDSSSGGNTPEEGEEAERKDGGADSSSGHQQAQAEVSWSGYDGSPNGCF